MHTDVSYTCIYIIKIIDSKDPFVQLTIIRQSIKDFFKYLLNEIKGFKYQVTLKELLSKCKGNAEREFATVYFNSTTKAEIGPKDILDRSFHDAFNSIDNWISKGFGWVNESIVGEYDNVSIYSPVLRSSYIEVPYRLRNSKKGFDQY